MSPCRKQRAARAVVLPSPSHQVLALSRSPSSHPSPDSYSLYSGSHHKCLAVLPLFPPPFALARLSLVPLILVPNSAAPSSDPSSSYCLQTPWLPLVLPLFLSPYFSCSFLPLLSLPWSLYLVPFTSTTFTQLSVLTFCPFSFYTHSLLTFSFLSVFLSLASTLTSSFVPSILIFLLVSLLP